MHHLVTDVLFDALMAVLVVGFGCAIIAPMLDRMPPVRMRLVVALWAALFLGMPAVWSATDGYLGSHRHSYLYELGHSWMVYTMFLSGLLTSFVRRWRRRVR